MEKRSRNAQNFWQDPHKACEQSHIQTGRDTDSIHSPRIQKEQRKTKNKKLIANKQVQNTDKFNTGICWDQELKYPNSKAMIFFYNRSCATTVVRGVMMSASRKKKKVPY